MRKLVRDKIPALMAADGINCHPRQLEHPKLGLMLREKILEEARELVAAEPDEFAEEAADLLDVLQALVQYEYGRRGWGMVAQVSEAKRIAKGGFTEGWEITVPCS